MVQNLTFILRRRGLLLVLLPLVVTVAVVFLAPTPESPEAEFRSRAYLAGDPGDITAVFLEQAALDIVQPATAQAAAEVLDRPAGDARDLIDLVEVEVDEDALTLTITATSPVRAEPEPVAEAFAEVFAASVNEDQRARRLVEVAAAQEVVDGAEANLVEFNLANPQPFPGAPVDEGLETERQAFEDAVNLARQELARLQALPPPIERLRLVGVDPVSRAPEPKLQLPANRAARGSMAFLLGVIGAVGIAAFLERLNPRIDDAGDAERIIGAPVLAGVPVVGRRQRARLARADFAHFHGPFAEAFRSMRSHLDFLSSQAGTDGFVPRVMLVSAAPAEGKSTSSAYLALAYLETERDVLVVGGDLRRPRVHSMFGVRSSPGLSSRLMGPGAPELTELIVRDPVTGAMIVPSGPATSRVTGLLHDLSTVAEVAQDAGRVVIVDSPPIVVANDAVDFLPCVDWVIVVVRAGRTSERAVRSAMQQLELNQAKVVGCVMVGSLESSDAKRYYYGYYDTGDTLAARMDAATAGSNGHGLRVAAGEPEEQGSDEAAPLGRSTR